MSVESRRWPASATIAVGQEVVFDFLLYNAGPSTATSLKFTETLSGPVTVVEAYSAGSCTGSGPVVCTLDPSLLPGQHAQVTVRLRATGVGSITSRGEVAATEPDPTSSNNTATDTLEVVPGADVAVESQATSTGPVAAITHTITNHGPDSAPGVTVVVGTSHPATVSADQGRCTPGPGAASWTCELGTLAHGQAVPVVALIPISSPTYAAAPTFGGIGGTSGGVGVGYGPSGSVAEAKSAQADPNSWNNSNGSSVGGSTFSPSVTPCTLIVVRGLCNQPI